MGLEWNEHDDNVSTMSSCGLYDTCWSNLSPSRTERLGGHWASGRLGVRTVGRPSLEIMFGHMSQKHFRVTWTPSMRRSRSGENIVDGDEDTVDETNRGRSNGHVAMSIYTVLHTRRNAVPAQCRTDVFERTREGKISDRGERREEKRKGERWKRRKGKRRATGRERCRSWRSAIFKHELPQFS